MSHLYSVSSEPKFLWYSEDQIISPALQQRVAHYDKPPVNQTVRTEFINELFAIFREIKASDNMFHILGLYRDVFCLSSSATGQKVLETNAAVENTVQIMYYEFLAILNDSQKEYFAEFSGLFW